MMTAIDRLRPGPGSLRGLAGIVGFLVCVEITSGIIQGYYTPIYSDIADHLSIADADVNWFEAAQLILSAIAVPVLAKLGDLRGHRSVLLLSTALTALASWGVAVAPSFWTFLIAWSLQGFYVVWLPLEISIIHRRTAGTGRQTVLTRKAAGFLVAALEAGVIIGALASGVLIGATSIAVTLMIPAAAVTACFFVILFGIAKDGRAVADPRTRRLDVPGLFLLIACLGLLMAGLVMIRILGPGSVWPWLVIAAGLLVVVPFARVERRTAEPLIDVVLLTRPAQRAIQLTAFLFGMSVLGAQIPLSTFARTDPAAVGYGLGASAWVVSVLLGVYVLAMAAGALLLPFAARLLGPRGALVTAALLVAVGYALWLPLHGSVAQALINMAVIGLGAGGLVAALPSAAAADAPSSRTGFVTGMTNTSKTIGGAIASSVFAIALVDTGTIDTAAAGHAPLSGYLTVWTLCSLAALVAAICLLLVPRAVFADRVTEDA